MRKKSPQPFVKHTRLPASCRLRRRGSTGLRCAAPRVRPLPPCTLTPPSSLLPLPLCSPLTVKNKDVTHSGRGQNVPSAFSPRIKKVFSDFEYVPSEFDREKTLKAAEARKRRERNICVEDFKNFSMPEVVKGTGTFREYEYTIDPYETREVLASIEQRDRAGMQLGAPFKPAGAAGTDSLDQQRGKLEEAINTMASKLVQDWPSCLKGLEIVNDGFVVVAFDIHTKQKEGNIHAYMQK